ncbi:MAG TPA: bifunctional hydroxymethylpyrimidine kinase/phosphomethylpyrimidine kinase [Xanthobacteraceae bacterium]|jgi:hydroxymethylpyrimidine/phosphomethylpyrimidine kinase
MTGPVTPIAVTIAGSDSGGGAGLQGDLKTFSALGVYGASVVTALTAQNTAGVTAIHDVPADFVAAQMDAVFSDLQVGAAKIGMLSQPATIRAVAAGLDRWRQTRVVLDPVMVASSGDRLLAPDAIEVLKRELIPRAFVLTPNLPEAAALVGTPEAQTEDEMRAQAQALLGLGAQAVLIKGGHGKGQSSVDLLVDRNGTVALPLTRLATRNTHGTGCAFSAAIAAGLAKSMDMLEATRAAKAYVHAAIAAADMLAIGSGPGPVHHFHGVWPRL